jgi:hypothetical protein
LWETRPHVGNANAVLVHADITSVCSGLAVVHGKIRIGDADRQVGVGALGGDSFALSQSGRAAIAAWNESGVAVELSVIVLLAPSICETLWIVWIRCFRDSNAFAVLELSAGAAVDSCLLAVVLSGNVPFASLASGAASRAGDARAVGEQAAVSTWNFGAGCRTAVAGPDAYLARAAFAAALAATGARTGAWSWSWSWSFGNAGASVAAASSTPARTKARRAMQRGRDWDRLRAKTGGNAIVGA